MIQVTNKLVALIQKHAEDTPKNATTIYYKNFIDKVLEAFASKTFNIEEVKLIRQAFRDYFMTLSEKDYFDIDMVNYYIGLVNQSLKPYDYTDTETDKTLKALYWLYHNKDNVQDLINFRDNKVSSEEMFKAVSFIVDMYNKLKSPEVRLALMSEIHLDTLSERTGFGKNNIEVSKASINRKYCMDMCNKLGFYKPEDAVLFFKECQTLGGVAESQGYSNEIRLTGEDLEALQKRQATNQF